MNSTIEMDGQSFDATIEHFSFEGFHELLDQNELSKLGLFTHVAAASFCETNLDDTGLAHVCAVTTIESLDLQDTAISNEGLSHLARLPGLEYLRLKDNAQLTNSCVPHLLRLTSLTNLQIHETSINQVGLSRLVPLQQLEDICLDVWDGNYTLDGLTALSMKMPNCTILAKSQGEFKAGKFSGKWRG